MGDSTIRMSGIKNFAIEDGVGVRMSLYSSICPHRCDGCHNPNTWNYENGYDATIDELFDCLIKNKHISGVTFSGGDPFAQSMQFYYLALKIRSKTKLDIWSYTGYTYEEILLDKSKRLLLEQCDVIVDGKFVKELKDIKLPFRGSSNQRIIDVQKSLKSGEVVLYSA